MVVIPMAIAIDLEEREMTSLAAVIQVSFKVFSVNIYSQL